MGQDVSVPVGTSTMDIYMTEPDKDARGAVIVLQEAFGVNDHIRDLCHRFAAAGYVAVAPHLFHRSGDPELGYEDMQEVMVHIMQLEADKLEADLEATFALLASWGTKEDRSRWSASAWAAASPSSQGATGSSALRSASTEAASPRAASGCHRCSTSPPPSRRHGWVCSASLTVQSQSTRSRDCAKRQRRRGPMSTS